MNNGQSYEKLKEVYDCSDLNLDEVSPKIKELMDDFKEPKYGSEDYELLYSRLLGHGGFNPHPDRKYLKKCNELITFHSTLKIYDLLSISSILLHPKRSYESYSQNTLVKELNERKILKEAIHEQIELYKKKLDDVEKVSHILVDYNSEKVKKELEARENFRKKRLVTSKIHQNINISQETDFTPLIYANDVFTIVFEYLDFQETLMQVMKTCWLFYNFVYDRCKVNATFLYSYGSAEPSIRVLDLKFRRIEWCLDERKKFLLELLKRNTTTLEDLFLRICIGDDDDELRCEYNKPIRDQLGQMKNLRYLMLEGDVPPLCVQNCHKLERLSCCGHIDMRLPSSLKQLKIFCMNDGEGGGFQSIESKINKDNFVENSLDFLLNLTNLEKLKLDCSSGIIYDFKDSVMEIFHRNHLKIVVLRESANTMDFFKKSHYLMNTTIQDLKLSIQPENWEYLPEFFRNLQRLKRLKLMVDSFYEDKFTLAQFGNLEHLYIEKFYFNFGNRIERKHLNAILPLFKIQAKEFTIESFYFRKERIETIQKILDYVLEHGTRIQRLRIDIQDQNETRDSVGLALFNLLLDFFTKAKTFEQLFFQIYCNVRPLCIFKRDYDDDDYPKDEEIEAAEKEMRESFYDVLLKLITVANENPKLKYFAIFGSLTETIGERYYDCAHPKLVLDDDRKFKEPEKEEERKGEEEEEEEE